MSLLSWLTGAAKRSAKSGGRSTQTKKKRQKKQQEQKPKQQARPSSKPSQSRTRTSSASSSRGGSSYKPKTYHGTSKPATRQTNVFQPRTFKPSASKTQTRYAQFKASNAAPKAFKATTKPPEKKQEKKPIPVKGAITKATVSPTTKSKSRFDLPKDYDYKKDLQQAYKKGSKTTYLGTQQKETTKTLKTKEQMKKEYDSKKVKKSTYYKSQEWKNQKNYLKTKNQEGWRKALSDAGWSRKEIDDWMKSEEGMKNRRETYFAAKEDIKKAINKDIEGQNNKLKKQIKSTSKLKSVNALTRSEFNKMTTASAMGKERGNKYLKSVGGDKLLEKIGSKTADAAIRAKFASGVMQGMSPVDTFSGSVGKYNKSAKAAIKKTKGSGAYLAGYGVGFAAQMGMGNVASRGASLAGGAGKGAGKVASKVTGKEIAKTSIKGAARETGKLTSKQAAKRFAANRAGQVVAETPANIADAAKMAMDEDGKINKKEFKKWLAINSAATAGIGGAMEGIGAAATRKLGNKTVELIAKREAGTITKEESEKLTKYIEKLSQKQKAEIKSISSDIAEARMAKIDADSAARAKKVAEAEAQNVPKKFHGRGSRYTQTPKARAARARANYAEKLAENERRVANRAKMNADEFARNPQKATTEAEKRAVAQASKNYSEAIASTTERARVNEVHRLQDELRTLKETLPKAEAKSKNAGTMEAHARAEAQADEIRKAIDIKENQLKNAQGETLSGRLGKAQAKVKNSGTYASHDKAVKNLEKVEAEVKADAEKKISKLKAAAEKAAKKAEKNPTPENKVRAEIAQEAVEKAESDAKKAAPKAAESVPSEQRPTELNEPKAEATEPKKTKYEERQQKDIDTHNERIAEIDGEIANIDRQLKDLDKQGKDFGWQKKNTDIPERAEELQKGLDSVDALKTSLKEEKWKLSREKTELQGKVTDAEEKIRKINEAKEPEGGYARLPGEEADMVGIKETPAVDKIVKETAQDLDNAPVKPKTVEPSKITENGVVDATTKKKKPLSEIYHNVVRTAVFDSLDPLEHIANHLPNEARKAMLAQINEFRRAIKTGRAIVATKGRDIYKRYGLTDRKNKAKMADFERYCFLKHDLARVKEGSGFTGLDEAGIRKEISDLESRYSEELFPVIDKETGEVLGSELQLYQKDMVNYFRDLLKMEVDAGITSKEVANSFIKRFPDYVPSYREKAFQEILNNHTFEEIDVGRGMKAAKGGGKDPLVSLYNQMQTKTNTVIKRTELNKTLNMLCTASGTSEKELDKLVPFFKDMRPEEKAEALIDAQIFPHSAGNGKYTAYMYREGSKIEMNIDKDVYDAIRRWSGEDSKLVVLTKLFNNRVLAGANSQFKKWITDYNLIFGVKNFMRDQATALFYTTDKWGYFKNWPKGMGTSLLPRKAMPEYLQKAYKVYEENGGVISQFIARDSASDRLLDSTLNKYNPLKWVENFNSAMETVPRMTEFVSALDSMASKAAKNGGNYEEEFMKLLENKEAVSKAMYRAKDVTLNFDRSGWLGAVLNRGPVPFFNPAAQGFDKLGRTLIRDNIKYGENGAVLWAKSDGIRSFFDETTMGSLLKTGAYLTGMVAAPEVLYNSVFGDYVNGKVKGYEKQSDYNRNTHFLIPTGDGKFFKLPKARELASLQMMLDFTYDNMEYGSGSTWEKLFGDERVRDLKSMAKLSFEQSGPINPLTDSLVAPLWRVKNNQTWYGGKIESGADDERHREEGELYKIWDENTSGLAKAIGKQFNMSPKKVDNVMDSYLGLIYDMGIAQFSAKNDPRNTFKQEGFGKGIAQLTRTPWGNAFFIDSVFSNANKSDYFELVNRREKKLEGMKEGSKEYNELKAQMTKEKNAFAYNSTQYDELQSQIWLDDKMTAAEKRKYCRILKQGDNLLYHERSDGKLVASKDPMAVAWNLKNKDGKRVMSTDKIIDACSFEFKNGDNTIKDAWKRYKEGGGKPGKFMEVTLAARDCKRYAGDSLSTPRWEEVAYTSQLNHIKGRDAAVAAYIEDETKRNNYLGNAKVYEEFGGSKKTYYTMKRTTTQGAYDLGYDYPSQMRDGELTMVLANARTKGGKKYRDLAYQANGTWILDNRMNAGRCLDERLKGKYTSAKLKKFCDKYKLDPSEGHKWTDKDIEKVVNAINKEYKDDDNELKAAKFVTITGLTWKNPFGEIGDYSLDYDTGVYCVDSYKGYGRRRRRGWRRHGWHGWGGGGGGGAAFNPEVNKAGGAANQKLTDVKVTNIKVSDTSAKVRTKKSNLNDAYRKKVKKLREQTRHIK